MVASSSEPSPEPESPPPNQPLQPDESSVGYAAGSSAGASSESAEPSLPESCCDSAGAVEDGASLLVLAVSSQPVIPTPRTRARSMGAADLSSPRRLDLEEDTDETDKRENMGEIGDKKGAFTRASSQEKGWWAASR